MNYDGTPCVLVEEIAPLLNISVEKFYKKLGKLKKEHPEVAQYFGAFYDTAPAIYRDGMAFMGQFSDNIDKEELSKAICEFLMWDSYIKQRVKDMENEVTPKFLEASKSLSTEENIVYLKAFGLTRYMIKMDFTDDEIEAVLTSLYRHGLFNL